MLNAELEVKELSRDVYNAWLDLKEVRKSQGFSSTNSKLTVMKAELPYDRESLDSCVEFLQTVNEICTDSKDRAEQILNLYEQTKGAAGSIQNRKRRGQRRRKSRNSELLDGVGTYVLRLTEDSPYTKDEEGKPSVFVK